MNDNQQKEIFTKNLNRLINKSGKTQKEIADSLGLNPQTVNSWCTGNALPRMGKIQMLSDYFGVLKSDLIEDKPQASNLPTVKNIFPIETKRFPLLGEIACGEPRFTGDAFCGYVEAGADIQADFCLRARGDSMVGARIMDGDVVFVKEQPDVENGEIAAVILDDEATLKRINKNTPGFIFLMPENSQYKPIVINLDKLNESNPVRIIGKAVAFQSDVK